MRGLDPLWLVLAGLGAGLAGSIAGLASIVSYPALLAVGLPPIAANVTNTVSLVFSSIGSVAGSRPELVGQRQKARQLAGVAVAGGICGGLLLLATPSRQFALIVPWMIGLASVAILVRPSPDRIPAAAGTRPHWMLTVGVFVVGIYGGYFGAAAGVLLLALLLLVDADTLARANALKNLLLGLANGVAAVAFVFLGPVHWSAALPLGLGMLVGGRLGPMVVRRSPAEPLKVAIAAAGLGVAVYLGWHAYR